MEALNITLRALSTWPWTLIAGRKYRHHDTEGPARAASPPCRMAGGHNTAIVWKLRITYTVSGREMAGNSDHKEHMAVMNDEEEQRVEGKYL